MATDKPRVMVTVSDDMYEQIQNYRFTRRCKNMSQALNELIDLGLAEIDPQPTADLTEKEPVTMDELTEDERSFMDLFDQLTSSNQRLLLGIGAVILQEQQRPPD